MLEPFFGYRRFRITTNRSPAELCKALAPFVTPRQPHGRFRDWPNEKPYMGEVSDTGFLLREKTRFGKGWPLDLNGSFTKMDGQTLIDVEARVTPAERFVLNGFIAMAGLFYAAALYGLIANLSLSALPDILMEMGAPSIMLLLVIGGDKERVRVVEREMRTVLEINPV